MTMDCWHCGMELIWGGDHDEENHEDYDMVTNLSCPACNSLVLVYHSSEGKVFDA
jgi:DNA-directed RNA polymerase subunit RPC12/RpoP